MSMSNEKPVNGSVTPAAPVTSVTTPTAAPAAGATGPVVAHANNGFNGLLRSAEREREREMQNHQLARYGNFNGVN